MRDKRRPQVGLIGAGFMGKAVLWQAKATSFFDCVAVFDRNIEKIISFAKDRNIPCVLVSSGKEIRQALSKNVLAVCRDVRLIAECDAIDAVVDATGDIRDAASFCADVLRSGKDLVMINSEADLTFGPYFVELARENGTVYTSADGDQYTVLKRMIEEIKLWGIEIVMTGNIKGFLDRYANPTTIIPEADKRKLDHKMCAALADGTKLNIEMALMANSEGYITKRPGMFGPRAGDVREVFSCFDFPQLWNERAPFVDYILGAEPGSGVFVVGYSEDRFQQEMLRYYKMGNGPFYLFYRPYHLCHLEVTQTILDAVLARKAVMQPRPIRTTDVFAYAKKDLFAGDVLDGLGGYTCYGLIENMAGQESGEGLPICLADGVTITKSVKKDDKIMLSNVEYDDARPDYAVYYGRKQNRLQNQTPI